MSAPASFSSALLVPWKPGPYNPIQWTSLKWDPDLEKMFGIERPIGWLPTDGDTPLTKSQLKRRRRRDKVYAAAAQ
jgi:hypothetical protein